MSFSLSEQQRSFQRSVRHLAESELASTALERARSQPFPLDVAALFASKGLLGLLVPRSAGGTDAGVMAAVLAIEQVMHVCPRSGDVLHHGNFAAVRMIGRHGNRDQIQRFLVPVLEGRAVLGVAITEECAGSSVSDLRTAAVRDGEGFRLTGSKKFAAYSCEANTFLVYVRFGPDPSDVGALLVSRETEGLRFGSPVRYMNGEHWCDLVFDNAHVPMDDVLFTSGAFTEHIDTFDIEKIGNAARAIGLAWYAFWAARDHALRREQFGRPLCEFQGVQWKFAEMCMMLEPAQLMLYRAATDADAGAVRGELAAMAKLLCNQAAMRVCDEAVQIMGGDGYCDTSLVEHCFRKARGLMITGGTVELMRNRIAEAVFGRKFPQRLGSS